MNIKVSIYYLLLASVMSIAITSIYFKYRENTVIAEVKKNFADYSERLERCIPALETETEWSIKCEKERILLKTRIKNLEAQLNRKIKS
ncbi:MAG: hypothetical protein ABJO02_04660 [Reichenbachiella sp.]|uniref:hypothetical protein n=1 Tax=Reichenbachiella sp. TaxID=2184521 RepID=UPI00329848DB